MELALALKQDDNAVASRSSMATLSAGAGGGGIAPDATAARPRAPMAVESLLGD